MKNKSETINEVASQLVQHQMSGNQVTCVCMGNASENKVIEKGTSPPTNNYYITTKHAARNTL